jgi:hypothetical protein
MAGAGQDWTDEELDHIVADYFDMLGEEIAGVPFNKAAHNRALRDRVDRSKSSVEFKHRNISAVLVKLGLPRIKGYFPAENFQGTIIAAIDRFLSQNPIGLHPEKAVNGWAESQGLFVGVPPPLEPIAPRNSPLERLVRKFNPVERDFRNRKLGRDGEEMVFHHERLRLQQIDRPDLAKKIRWISEELGDGGIRHTLL